MKRICSFLLVICVLSIGCGNEIPTTKIFTKAVIEELLKEPTEEPPEVSFSTIEEIWESDRWIIGGTEVREAIKQRCGKSKWSMQIYLADSEYLYYSYGELVAYIAENDIDSWTYIREHRDCDDFARILIGDIKREFPGIAIGYAKVLRDGYYHALVIFYDPLHNPRVVLFEPQNDDVVEPKDSWWFRMITLRSIEK